ncbi:MAG: nucleotidyltransferase family protein, partial [Specibacter sp.]
ELVSLLLAVHQPGRITAAGYRPHSPAGPPARGLSQAVTRGHPIIFDVSLAAAAAATATGDAGARAFLAANPGLIDVIDCSALSDGADVDTPDDLHLLEG